MATRSKILYAASTASHLHRFHMPYIQALKEEHEVLLMATEGEGIDLPIAFAKSIFSFSNLRSIFKIRKILKRERFDRVILHTTLAAFLIRAAMIGMRHRPRVLNVVHGYLFCEPISGLRAKLMLFCEKLLRRKTDELAVMNQEDLRLAQKHRLCRSGEVSFLYGMGIPDPVELPEKDAALCAQYAAEGEFLCTFVGELSRRKNQIFLIRAAKQLRERGIPVKLLLAGEGSERDALEAEIRALDLGDIVFLPGNLEPIRPYLAITDLYVSASISEGLPFNVMEAMAAGLPVVMSDTKGQNDLHKTTDSHLYPLDNTDAFCEAVKQVYESGQYGIGACTYPHLEHYRLSAVFATDLAVLKGVKE